LGVEPEWAGPVGKWREVEEVEEPLEVAVIALRINTATSGYCARVVIRFSFFYFFVFFIFYFLFFSSPGWL
jgi:hypothetical protein